MDDKCYSEFMTLVGRRYSCRDYASTPVEKSTLLNVLEAAHMAPSACNKQPWKFLIVTNADRREDVCKCYSRDWIHTAPAFIICLGNHPAAWHRADNKDHTDVDISIATEHICLAATTLGLGSCWVCNFDAAQLRQLFQIPDDWEPIAIVPIGYPAKTDIPKKVRKPIEEIISWENF